MNEAAQTAEMQHILTEQKGAVGIITMARPERFNALDVKMARDLRKAALGYARDETIRCVILAGGEKVFCSGADLRYVRERGSEEDFSYLQPNARDVEANYGASFKEILEYIHSTISEIRRAPKPFVAAVRGVAAAGGFGLAMSCDLVFAAESASFEWAYPKTGLTGAESSTFFLTRLLVSGAPSAWSFLILASKPEKHSTPDSLTVSFLWRSSMRKYLLLLSGSPRDRRGPMASPSGLLMRLRESSASIPIWIRS